MFYTGTYATAKDVELARRLGATRFLVKSMAASPSGLAASSDPERWPTLEVEPHGISDAGLR